MQSSVWATLLRQIPTECHDQLMLTTFGGTEIAIQGILRIDHEFLAIKGRLAGSQDAGRVFFLPYCQIDYLGFQRALKEVRPSTRPWFEMARNYAMFANEGGMYDDLLAYMRQNKLL